MHQNQKGHGCQSNKDYGPQPLVVNIDKATNCNSNFRTALWTGEYLQVTVMNIPVGEEIGVEMHEDTDQFIRIEQGIAMVKFGKGKCDLKDIRRVNFHDAIIVPAGTWHNIINCGNVPLKVYSVYAPPQHPFGTVHKTKKDAEATH